MRIRTLVPTALVSVLLVGASALPAAACAGLVTPGGTVRLERTATLAAYANGVEHYVTSFQFSGGGAEFGSIVPLPAMPTKVEKGGEWTLQRLAREVAPPVSTFTGGSGSFPAAAPAPVVVYETRIDALDIRILKGGGRSVGTWAKEQGFRLTPDAPAVLEFYAARSPYFMAASFDAKAARDRGQQQGDGTPIHLTMPTSNPWVPLRILGLGVDRSEQIRSDVFLLTPRRPILMPVGRPGVFIERREPASAQLLDDLRSDKGMEWMPRSMWLTYLRIDVAAGQLRYDLATDVSGRGRPSRVMAGLQAPARPAPSRSPSPTVAPSTAPTEQVPVPVSTSPEPAVALRPAGSRSRAPEVAGVALLALVSAGVSLGLAQRRRARTTGE